MKTDELNTPGGADTIALQARSILKEAIKTATGKMTVREINLLALRFGLRDGYERSSEAVGRILGKALEETKSIEEMAVDKCLRTPLLHLSREIAGRMNRTEKRPGTEGMGDLSVACTLISKANQLSYALKYVLANWLHPMN